MSTAPASPAKTPGDRHGEEVVARHGDAAVARGVRVEADGTHLIPERRPADDDPERDEGAEREEEADVQALQDRITPEHRQLRSLDDRVRGRAEDLLRVLERTTLAEEIQPDVVAIQLSMIVEITSCAPTVALRIPAIPAQAAPASAAATTANVMCTKRFIP